MGEISSFKIAGTVITGIGAVEQIGEIVKQFHAGRATIITDKIIVNTGMADKIKELLTASGLQVNIFDGVEPEPSFQLIDVGLEAVLQNQAEIIIAVGGGSTLDIAKLVAVLATNEGSPKSFVGIGKIPKPGVPLIAIPTTSGTGSEVTNIGILLDKEQELKVGIVSNYLIPTVAIIDPMMTLTVPPAVTAATGMDALTHAIEAYVSVNASYLTDAYALKAIELITGSIRTAVADGGNVEARTDMSMGSLMAGIAFGNAGVGGVHALAYPLGGKFHISHGVSNSLMLPYVMEFNSKAKGFEERFASIGKAAKAAKPDMSSAAATQEAVTYVKKLADDIKVPKKLSEFGITANDIPFLAANGIKSTRLLANNPRIITEKDAFELYSQAL